MKEIKKIGEGTYSKVFSVEDKNGIIYAKKIFKNRYEDGIPMDMLREICFLSNINSPNVIKLLNVDYINFEYTLLPVYNCDLSFLLKRNVLHDTHIRNIFFKICSGIYALHCSGIIHRDIKPTNICVSTSCINSRTNMNDVDVVLIDTGYSKKIGYNRSHGVNSSEICITWYRPPELILGYKKYSFEIDIWSTGCILAEMYLEHHLFPYETELSVLSSQMKLVEVPEKLSFKNNLFKIIPGKGCLKKDFYKFGKDLFDLLTGMLRFDPIDRFSISQCLNSPYFNSKIKFAEFAESKNVYLDFLKNWNSDYYKRNDINDLITFKMRYLVVDWVLYVCSYYNTSDSVYFTTVMLIDVFSILKGEIITKNNYQLISMCCLLIASKLETCTHIGMKVLMEIIPDELYTQTEIREMEKLILRTCTPNFPNLFQYYLAYIKTENTYKEENKEILKNLVISTLQPEYLKFNFYTLTEVCHKYSQNIQNTKNTQNTQTIDLTEDEIKCYNCLEKWVKLYNDNPNETIEKKFN